MNYYCQKCFSKIEYKFSKPEKCPRCDFSFGVANTDLKNKNIDKLNQLSPINESKKIENLQKRLKFAESRLSDKEEVKNKEISDDDEYFEVPNWKDGISKLKASSSIHIDIEKPKSSSIGEIVASSNNENSDGSFLNIKRDRVSLNKQQILDELKKESSSAANPIIVD